MFKLMAFFILMYELYKFVKIVQEKKQAEMCAVWPTTRGRVTLSRIIAKEDADANGDTDESENTGSAPRKAASDYPPQAYVPRVVYGYEVNGIRYVSNKISMCTQSAYCKDIIDARLQVEKYPAGSEVTVYYDPENPAQAVLNPDDSQGMDRAFKKQLSSLAFWAVAFLISLVLPV